MLFRSVAVLVFLPVCAIGVLGSALVPGLEGSASDNIFRVLTIMLAGPVWGPVFSVAALAALMSTMDSQLLSCASMIGTDVLPVRLRSSGSSASIVLLLAAGAWLVALKPPVSILDFLGKTAFPGYASLAPVAIAGIYAPWLGKRTLSLVLFAGTGLVAIQSAGLLRPPLPAAIFNLGIQTLILCLGAAFLLIGRKIRFKAANPKPIAEYSLLQWVAPLTIGLIGVLGVDFWQYGSVSQLIPGIPRWVAYHAALTLSLSMAFWLYARSRRSV